MGVQRKSKDYPIEAFQNAICLFGGNAKPADKTPLETLQRYVKISKKKNKSLNSKYFYYFVSIFTKRAQWRITTGASVQSDEKPDLFQPYSKFTNGWDDE